MTEEQRLKLCKLYKDTAPLFSELENLNDAIRRYEQMIYNAKLRRAEVNAKIDEWEVTYMKSWAKIFNSQEAT